MAEEYLHGNISQGGEGSGAAYGDDDRSKVYQCMVCEGRFSSWGKMEKHIWWHLGDPYRWRCSRCRKTKAMDYPSEFFDPKYHKKCLMADRDGDKLVISISQTDTDKMLVLFQGKDMSLTEARESYARWKAIIIHENWLIPDDYGQGCKHDGNLEYFRSRPRPAPASYPVMNEFLRGVCRSKNRGPDWRPEYAPQIVAGKQRTWTQFDLVHGDKPSTSQTKSSISRSKTQKAKPTGQKRKKVLSKATVDDDSSDSDQDLTKKLKSAVIEPKTKDRSTRNSRAKKSNSERRSPRLLAAKTAESLKTLTITVSNDQSSDECIDSDHEEGRSRVVKSASQAMDRMHKTIASSIFSSEETSPRTSKVKSGKDIKSGKSEVVKKKKKKTNSSGNEMSDDEPPKKDETHKECLEEEVGFDNEVIQLDPPSDTLQTSLPDVRVDLDRIPPSDKTMHTRDQSENALVAPSDKTVTGSHLPETPTIIQTPALPVLSCAEQPIPPIVTSNVQTSGDASIILDVSRGAEPTLPGPLTGDILTKEVGVQLKDVTPKTLSQLASTPDTGKSSFMADFNVTPSVSGASNKSRPTCVLTNLEIEEGVPCPLPSGALRSSLFIPEGWELMIRPKGFVMPTDIPIVPVRNLPATSTPQKVTVARSSMDETVVAIDDTPEAVDWSKVDKSKPQWWRSLHPNHWPEEALPYKHKSVPFNHPLTPSMRVAVHDAYRKWTYTIKPLNPDPVCDIEKHIGVFCMDSYRSIQDDYECFPARLRTTQEVVHLSINKELGNSADVFRSCSDFLPYFPSTGLEDYLKRAQHRYSNVQVPIDCRYYGPYRTFTATQETMRPENI